MRAHGEIEVVCDQHQRRLELLVEFLHQFHDKLARFPVQVAGRLVREQNPRLVGERPCKGHPLLLTTGELSRIVARAVSQTHPFQERRGPRTKGVSILARSALSKFQGHHHVLKSRKRGKEMEGLEDESYVLCAKPRPTVFGKSLEIFTGYGYRALRRLV